MEYERKLEAPSGFELPDLGGEPLEPRVFTSIYQDTATRSLARAGITLRRRTEHGARAQRLAESAEVTVDEVAAMDAQRVEGEFVEIEIELRDGDPALLSRIVKELERAGARLGNEMPKLFRVLAIEPRPRRPKKPFEALQALLREQLDQILAHDPGTRLGNDPESLHDMRVAVRRTRALLRAGAPLVAGDMQPLRAELQWLGTVLGDVRDLDVMLGHLRGQAASLDPADGAAAGRLLRALERQRTRARRVLLKALDEQRYADLLDLYEQTLEALEPSGSGRTLAQLAGREAKRLRGAVRAAGDEPVDEQLHDLRKRGKRTRYAHELSGATGVVRRAKAFQDVLGEHQDSVVAEERLRALSHEAPADQALAAGLLIERERTRREDARKAWRQAWRRLDRSTR